MEAYQPIYDAVRSRIRNGDVGAVIESVAREAFDISHLRMMMQEVVFDLHLEWKRPSVLFRPNVGLDGDKYSVLYGENLMDGCCGFGGTLEEAMRDFDKNWFNHKAKPNVDI